MIETLNLVPGVDYTLGAGGLIQIDEDVLNKAMERQMQETHRAQAQVYGVEAKMERYNQKQIIKDFMNAVNTEAARQGSGSRIDQSQAKIILENSANGTSSILGELKKFITIGEAQNKNLDDINKTSVKNSENVCKAVGKTSSNFESAIKGQELDISDSISSYLPSYLESQARERSKELMEVEQDIYGYLDADQINSYKNMSEGSKEAIRNILLNKKSSGEPDVKYDEDSKDWKKAEEFDKKGGGFWYGLGHMGQVNAHSRVGEDVDKVKDEYLKYTQG